KQGFDSPRERQSFQLVAPSRPRRVGPFIFSRARPGTCHLWYRLPATYWSGGSSMLQFHRFCLLTALGALALIGLQSNAHAQNAQAERGKYLVTLGSCTDCHTPGYFFGKPDMDRFLGGSE